MHAHACTCCLLSYLIRRNLCKLKHAGPQDCKLQHASRTWHGQLCMAPRMMTAGKCNAFAGSKNFILSGQLH